MVEVKFDGVAEFTEEERKELKSLLDRIGLASWGFLLVLGAYPFLDHKRLHPTVDKYIRVLDKLIERYKALKERKLKVVV